MQDFTRIKALLRELLKEIDELDGPTLRAVEPDEVEIEGMIGRPEMKEVRGRTLFTAGLKPNGETEWLSIAAWGEVAVQCATIRKGAMVRVVGKVKETQYVNGQGMMTSKRELTASLVSPLIGVAGFAESPSNGVRA